MRIAICDDDRDFCMQTVRMVREALDRRRIKAEVESFERPAALLAARTPDRPIDAYFLDILMSGMDGLTLARKLRETQPRAPIAFLTTSEDHALEAFSLDAAHYVLKPLETVRLDATIDRLLALLPKAGEEMLVVRDSEGALTSVARAQIVRTEADGHYQNLLLTDGRRVRCRLSGVELWEKLSPTGAFVLASKGVLLGIRHVRSLAAGGAVLSTGETVPVSRRAQAEVRQAFLRYNCR